MKLPVFAFSQTQKRRCHVSQDPGDAGKAIWLSIDLYV
jgi:hypothetical protein